MEEKKYLVSSWQLSANRFKSRLGTIKQSNIYKTGNLLIAVVIGLGSVYSTNPIIKPNMAFAATQGELNSKMSNLKEEMDSLKVQLDKKRNEKASLQNEVAIFDAQIRELELKIETTNIEIANINSEIKNTNEEISRLLKEIKIQKDLLRENIKVLYEEGQVNAVEVVASSENFSDFLNTNEYLSTIQSKINTVLEKVKNLRSELESKKKSLEEKKKELDKLKVQQNGQKSDLNSQRSQKNSLLAQVANSEANYSAILDSKAAAYRNAQTELSNILNKPVSTGRFSSAGSVRRGDIIGYQGNTGYSFGSHLHFGVYIGSQDVDPMPYLYSGKIGWPLSSYSITQGYWGSFSHKGVGWPGGLDLSQYQGAPIYAAADGNIIYNANSGPFGHHVIIAHPNGLRTLYAHMQP